MGIGQVTLDVFQGLYGHPALAKGCSICDLGAQVVQVGDPFVPARDYFSKQGFRYACIDLNGEHGVLRLDLNTCKAADVGGPFDTVTNHGTSEHCFDQANVFRLMHDLCRPGGLMIHLVPARDSGEWNCFFWYSPVLFEELAAVNHYKVLRLESFVGLIGGGVLVVFEKQRDAPLQTPFNVHA